MPVKCAVIPKICLIRLKNFLAIICDACMIRTSSDTIMTKAIKLKLQSKRDKQIVISIDNTLDEKLMELAEATDMSVSTVGYQILKQAIEHVEA